jgi:DNA-binding transcriptional LysR family regulator
MNAKKRRTAAAPALELGDLPLVLALGRRGTLAGAAESLDVDLSTVFRRLNRLEQGLRVRLFDRSPHGYQPTDAGRRALESAERVETELQALDRDIGGRDQALCGKVRVTASETLSYRVLPPQIARFRAAHPGIDVELAIDNRVLDLQRREADVALRVRRPTDPDLYGRRLATIAWAIYAARDYGTPLRRARGGWDFSPHTVIGWEEGVRQVAASEWLAAHVPAARVLYRSSSLLNHMMAARAGVGLAMLPCYLGDAEAELKRLTPVLDEPASELWIVTHKALRDTARIRAFLSLVGDGIAAQRTLMEGGRR